MGRSHTVQGGGLVALYASGTESSPVVIIDWDRLEDSGVLDYSEDEVAVSILHELRHAWQEAEQKLHPWQEEWSEDMDVEADADDWARATWTQAHNMDSPSF